MRPIWEAKDIIIVNKNIQKIWKERLLEMLISKKVTKITYSLKLMIP